MSKKRSFWISVVIQGVFFAACLLNVAICLIYQSSYDTEMGGLFAEIALHLTGILLLIPILPIVIVLNICAKPPKDNKTTRVRWLTWNILSPILYVVMCFITLGVFISTTGGV